jgi:hypothetical protein
MASTRERLALALLLLAYAGFALGGFDPTLSLGGDDARYLVLADALASGRGYRDLHMPGEPLHAFYPPLYPALLVPIRAAGGGLVASKALSLLAGACAVVFGYALARRRVGFAGACGVGAALALNPTLQGLSHETLSEACFLAFVLASLCFAESAPRRRDTALAIACAACAYLTRSAGIALLAALPLAWWIEGRRRAALAAAGAGACAMAAWMLYAASVPERGGPGYLDVMFLVDPYAPERGRLGLGGVLARSAGNALAYARDALPSLMAGGSGTAAVGVAGAVGLLALAGIGAVRSLPRPRALECYAACYAGLLLLWSGTWPSARYLLPLLPALLVLALEAVAALAASRGRWLVPAAGALLVLLALPHDLRSVARHQACRELRAREGDLACYPAPWRAYFELARWAGEHLPRDAVVVARKPHHFHFFSGLHADVYPFTSDASALHVFLDATRASHVVLDGVGKETERYLVPAVRALPQRFVLAHRVQRDGSSASLLAIRR